MKKLPIVGVMGSGKNLSERAERLGQWLATKPVHLLSGAGDGVMKSVSKGFASVDGRQGLIIGVVPGTITGTVYERKSGYPNPYVEIPINTHLHLSGAGGTDKLSRNHINVLSSDLIIALPGGKGTASEVQLALNYSKPLVIYVDKPEDIVDLPKEAHKMIKSDLKEVKQFVRDEIKRVNSKRLENG